MKKKSKVQPPSMPRIISYESYFDPPPRPTLPTCSATVCTDSTIAWRQRDARQLRKADRLGVPLLNCFQRATYQIAGQWYCKKHAGVIALELLAEEAP